MAMTKEQLMKAKLEKQGQSGQSSFDLGSKPIVETRAAEPVKPVVRERKDRRVQLLTYGSLIDRMDAYAERIGMSRAEVFEAAVSAYLDQYDK